MQPSMTEMWSIFKKEK